MAEKRCRNCKEWLLQETVICPHCKQRASMHPVQGVIIILLLSLIALGIYYSSTSMPKTQITTIQQKPQTIYSLGQIKSAKQVISTLITLAKVREEGEHLVVEFTNYLYPEDINKRLDFVRTIADADCVLNEKPRTIYFYNPGNILLAKADKINGVRLE